MCVVILPVVMQEVKYFSLVYVSNPFIAVEASVQCCVKDSLPIVTAFVCISVCMYSCCVTMYNYTNH